MNSSICFEEKEGWGYYTAIDLKNCNSDSIQSQKKIEEFIGLVNSSTDELSIARMTSPTGWSEPGQTPEFDEYTIVLKGMLRVQTKNETIDVCQKCSFGVL